MSDTHELSKTRVEQLREQRQQLSLGFQLPSALLATHVAEPHDKQQNFGIFAAM